MTPYYQDDRATIYNADCREVLPQLTDVGLVLTSPPYNLRNGGSLDGTKKEWSQLADGYSSYTDDLPHEDYVAWQRDVLSLCWNTLADDGAIYYQHKPITRGNAVRLPLELVPDGMPLRQIVVWDRGSGFNRNLTHYVPSYEWVLLLTKENFRITSRDVFDVWRIPPSKADGHPASFPVKLATRAIATTSAKTVLDPFMGSGTTLRAAKDCGRRSIGIEIDERYCDLAARLLSQEVLDLGDTA